MLGVVLVTAVTVASFMVFLLKTDWNHTKRVGAIVSNGAECGPIGKDVIDEGGSAVDAIIAVLLCEGAILPHSVGIGGGFIATIYDRQRGTVESLVSREMAPAKADMHMFGNTSSLFGGISIAIPGEIKGYFAMHQKYGRLPWKRLFEPTIKLCLEGHPLTAFLHKAMIRNETILRAEKTFHGLFVNPDTGLLMKVGDTIRQPKLAETLQIIADNGADTLYGGELGRKLVHDVQERGGIMTIEDLKNFKVKWTYPTKASFMNYTVYSTPLPGGGAVLSMILNLINKKLTHDKALLWHRLIESFKHAYGRRSLLGDVDKEPHVNNIFEDMTNPEYASNLLHLIDDESTSHDLSFYGAKFTAQEDHGTAAMSVLHPNGDAVTITSTINDNFGSKILSPSTGIILNDNMDDFSKPGITNYYGYPPSPSNFIKPYKRPLSSMCPTIVLDKNGDVKMMIGATGGSKIPTSIAQVIIRYLLLNEPIYDAIQMPRFHHQLSPNMLRFEQGFDAAILKELKQKGHLQKELVPMEGFATVTGIGSKGVPEPVYDNRRGGSAITVQSVHKFF
ncbi:hypothetical protein ACFFRR_002675 [Megaselia abdita]